MSVKLSKKSLLNCLPVFVRVTPVALSLWAGSFAFGQSPVNRYDQYRYSLQPLPAVQVMPSTSYPSGFPSAPQTIHSHELQPGLSVVLPHSAPQSATQSTPSSTGYVLPPPRRPEAASGRTQYQAPQMAYPPHTNGPVRTPRTQAMNAMPSMPSAPAKPIVPPSPNFADVQEVGRGLGTPGLITPGSVQRMEQSGLVVEDFRPPQPHPQDFSLEGLPPEARRAFYDQLQLPEGGRVMSARVLSADPAAPSEPQTAEPPKANAAPLPIVDPTPTQESPRQPIPSVPNALSIPAAPVQDKDTETAIAPPTVSPSSVTPVPVINPEVMEIAKASEHAVALEKRFAKQHEDMQAKVQRLTEQNAALESKIIEVTERLSKLEQAHKDLEKQLENTSKPKDPTEEASKPNKQDSPQNDKDKAPDKKGKKKPKDRVEV